MLGCIQPMSSPMMTTILGFCVVAACACALTASPASQKLDMAIAHAATFRTLAPKSILNLLWDVLLVGLREGRIAMGEGSHQRSRLASQRGYPARETDFLRYSEAKSLTLVFG